MSHQGQDFQKYVPPPKAQDMLAPQRTLFVTGLDSNCTRDVLMGAFVPFGDITEVVLDPGSSHGFVEFEDPEDVAAAIQNMHQSELFGKTISVSRARGSTLDKKRAIWEKEADEWVEEVENERAEQQRSEQSKTQRIMTARTGESQSVLERPLVFFDMTIDGQAAGRIEMELFSDVAPKCAENFRALCTGEKGTGSSGKALHYRSSPLHRIIPGFMLQGGDFTRGNGTGGESIFGDKFADENFVLRHASAGLLSMANAGPDTNGSQFFITLAPAPWLDGKHTVFGKVVRGRDVCKKLEKYGTKDGKPTAKIVVADCGQIERGAIQQAAAAAPP